MTNEKMLERLMEIKRLFTEDEKEFAELVSKSNLKDVSKSIIDYGTSGRIQALINTLEAEIKEEAFIKSSKSSGKDALKYAKAWQKKTKSTYAESKPLLPYPNYEDDYQVFCDGYSVVFLKDHLPFEDKPENFTGEYPVKMKENYPNVENLNQIELPSLSQLDAYVKAEKIKNKSKPKHSDKRIMIILPDTHIGFNAEILQTIMHIIPNGKAYLSEQHRTYRDATQYFGRIAIEDESGNKAVIMGITLKPDTEIIPTQF